jgi:hypothetical protein
MSAHPHGRSEYLGQRALEQMNARAKRDEERDERAEAEIQATAPQNACELDLALRKISDLAMRGVSYSG